MWPGRSRLEIDECERSESLLNVACGAEAPLSLLCAYDGSTLPEEVLSRVSRCHRVAWSSISRT